MAGELDFALFHLSLGDYPTMKKNEVSGDYRAMLWDGSVADTILFTNHNLKGDPALAELLRAPKFKQALSLAIDREEINELTYAGTAKAIALSPPEGSGAYEERFTRMWADFDPAEAKRMLDEIGVVDKDGDGMREMPGGKKLVIEVMVPTNWQEHPETAELIQSYWDDIGVQMTIKNIPYNNIVEFINANDYEAAMWKESIIAHPMNFLRRGFKNAFVDHDFAPLWAVYTDTDGAQGEKPSAEYMEGYNLLADALAEVDEGKRNELIKKVWENYYENLWTIGINQQVPSPIIASNRLKNVPENALSGYDIRTPVNAMCFQWYIDE
jgi:peptide/nickel transport system substrate-binding protein